MAYGVLKEITEKLEEIGDLFWEAYGEVKGWWSPFDALAIPLFYIAAGFYILSSRFADLDEWLSELAAEVAGALTLDSAYLYFKVYLVMAADAWDWVVNAPANIWNSIDNWWSSTRLSVLAWVDEAKSYAFSLYTGVNTWLAQLQSNWDSFVGKIPTIDGVISWWNNWTGNVLAAITSWWPGALLEVTGLINSAFLERESWWAGWSDFRNQVAAFFDDPLEFLWGRFADWFLGPEA